jgi:uncharacterized protein YndB with AHSA1/START domain
MFATAAANSAGKEFVVSRSFTAPRDLVWAAWTQSERLAQWWGPKGSKVRTLNLEVRPGGMFHYIEYQPGKPVGGRTRFGAHAVPRSSIRSAMPGASRIR